MHNDRVCRKESEGNKKVNCCAVLRFSFCEKVVTFVAGAFIMTKFINNLMRCRYWIVGLLVLFCTLVPSATSAESRSHADFHTPLPGSAERREVLDLLRAKIAELHALDVVFVVKRMEISKGWAWVHTLPRSRDGRSRYEDFFALLHQHNGRWRIAEIPCTEPDNAECIDSPDYFRHLRERFPAIPDFRK